MRAFVLLSALSLATTASAQTLTMTGDCPGTIDVEIEGITPGGSVAILLGAAGRGTDVIGAGPCLGTRTDLAGLRLATRADDRDRDGVLAFSPTLSGGRCETPVQAIDLETCEVSNVATGAGAGPGLPFEHTYPDDGDTCPSFNDWRASLPASGLRGMRMYGSLDEEGITCTDPVVAQELANAIRTNVAYIGSCDGHEWSVCDRYTGEIWIDPPSLCSGSNCPSPGYIIRPCIGGYSVPGGVNAATCSNIPQTMGIEFF